MSPDNLKAPPKNEIATKLFMQWLRMLGGTFSSCNANVGAANEAYTGQKGQLLQCVVAGTMLSLGSLQARDRS